MIRERSAGGRRGRVSKYPYFGVPPPREHRPAVNEPALTGKRLILSTPEGFIYDMRAWSEVYTDGEGGVVIDIVTENLYYEHRFTGRVPVANPWPAHLVWID